MKRAVLGILGTMFAILARHAPPMPVPKAVCLVCKERRGDQRPRTVKATRVHAGVVHEFCSERCAEEFAGNPAAYTFTTSGSSSRTTTSPGP
jgi:hypothetical protein